MAHPVSLIIILMWTETNALLRRLPVFFRHPSFSKEPPSCSKTLTFISVPLFLNILFSSWQIFFPTEFLSLVTLGLGEYLIFYSYCPVNKRGMLFTLVTGYVICSHYFVWNFLKVLVGLNIKVGRFVDACLLSNHV